MNFSSGGSFFDVLRVCGINLGYIREILAEEVKVNMWERKKGAVSTQMLVEAAPILMNYI